MGSSGAGLLDSWGSGSRVRENRRREAVMKSPCAVMMCERKVSQCSSGVRSRLIAMCARQI